MKMQASGSCEYVGGDIRACMIPHDCSYFELMHYLVEEKAYGPCSIRYEAVQNSRGGGGGAERKYKHSAVVCVGVGVR